MCGKQATYSDNGRKSISFQLLPELKHNFEDTLTAMRDVGRLRALMLIVMRFWGKVMPLREAQAQATEGSVDHLQLKVRCKVLSSSTNEKHFSHSSLPADQFTTANKAKTRTNV